MIHVKSYTKPIRGGGGGGGGGGVRLFLLLWPTVNLDHSKFLKPITDTACSDMRSSSLGRREGRGGEGREGVVRDPISPYVFFPGQTGAAEHDRVARAGSGSLSSRG